jgi:predicted ATP-dependent endonuclease of OLD family
MILKSMHVKTYKSVTDSGLVPIDPEVTCLVGKNESGKTAVLEALYRLNPLPGARQTFDPLRDYPRRTYNRDRDKVPGLIPIEAVFELEDEDIETVNEEFGEGVLTKGTITARKNYKNELTWHSWPFHEDKLIAHLLNEAGMDAKIAEGVTTIDALVRKLKGLDDPPAAVAPFLKILEAKKYAEKVWALLLETVPKFLYFDDYSIMPGRVSIHKLQNTPAEKLDAGERTALSLLRLAGVEAKEFTQAEYEARKASLEAAANQLTDEVFEYWSQNTNLAIELDVDFNTPASDRWGSPPFLDVRIRNNRHRVTLNFGERSQGFVWFFSFLAYFSEFRDSDDPLILLLDEPGLGLHAAAQGDLLRFIDERLAPDHQVLYSTHSPFLIAPTRLDRVRTVEDVDNEGTKVSMDVLSTTKDTRFPLQAALGYDLAQTLFLGPDNLVVEGPADYLYFQVIGGHLAALGRTNLNSRWVIVPVGGMDKIPTFVALLGAQLSVAVVLDVASGGSQKISSLVERGIIAGEKLLPLTEITKTPEADIEDLFEQDFYIDLLVASKTVSVKASQLKGTGRILKRIEVAIGSKFDHYQPARYFLENQVALLPKLSAATLDRFDELFKRANALLA